MAEDDVAADVEVTAAEEGVELGSVLDICCVSCEGNISGCCCGCCR